jgi:hypothetical protein
MKDLEKFAGDLRAVLNGDYTLSNGTKVRGNALSYVQDHMRSKGWRGMTYYNVTTMIEKLPGFKMSRGRGVRVYHGAKMGLGVECDVVHTVPTPGPKMLQDHFDRSFVR